MGVQTVALEGRQVPVGIDLDVGERDLVPHAAVGVGHPRRVLKSFHRVKLEFSFILIECYYHFYLIEDEELSSHWDFFRFEEDQVVHALCRHVGIEFSWG